MKRIAIAATLVALFFGTSVFAADQNNQAAGKATTEKTASKDSKEAKGGKAHKKHHAKKVHAMADKKEAAPKADAPAKAPAKAPVKK